MSELTEERLAVWVLVAISCADCNSMSVLVLNREPTSEDELAVSASAGGMFCINVRTVSGPIGEPMEWEQQWN